MTEKQKNSDNGKMDELMLELIERRLEEKLIQRVETTLKWRYSLIAAAFAFALVVAGVAWNEIIRVAVDGVTNQAKEDIDTKIEELSSPAETRLKELDIMFGVVERMAKDGTELAFKAKKKFAELGPTLDAISILEDRQRDIDARTKDLIVTVGSQPISELIGDLREEMADIGGQVDRLSQIIAKLPAAERLEAEDGSTANNVRKDVVEVVQRTNEKIRKNTEAQKMPTIFIQFAAGPREQAQALGAALRAAGYNVPPEDRENGAVGRREVRFFNQVDAAPAKSFVEATNKALKDLGYSDLKVHSENLTDYRGIKPRPGVLELWIELPRLSSQDFMK